jgi:hypothetical protein
MLIYSVIFGTYSALCAFNSVLDGLSLTYIIPAIFLYIVVFLGNVLYATNRSNILPSQFWRVTLTLITLDYFLRPIYGKYFGTITYQQDTLTTLKVNAMAIILFIPSFGALYIISSTNSTPA